MTDAYEVPVGSAALRVRAWAATDVGTVRRVNEDSHLAEAPLFVVADGMGGHRFGDRASQAAIGAFRALLDEQLPALHIDEVLDTVAQANRDVWDIGEDPAGGLHTFSGTTLTGMALVTGASEQGLHWLAFNVGDSRVYRVLDAGVEQLSVDHSVVQELLDRGIITAGEALVHPERNVITRALGSVGDVDADVWLFPIERHQTFLLCSDGLTKELGDAEIGAVVESWRSAPDADPAALLVSAAVAAGGRDNVTVVVVETELIGSEEHVTDTVDRMPDPRLEDTRPRP